MYVNIYIIVKTDQNIDIPCNKIIKMSICIPLLLLTISGNKNNTTGLVFASENARSHPHER